MFAILGAAGKIGYSTSKALRASGAPVRAILRNGAGAERLKAIGCDITFADLQDAAALAEAVAGAEAIQIILPPQPRAEDMGADMRRSAESLARALEKARPAVVLAISDYGAHLAEDVGIPTIFSEFEQRLRQVDTKRIILRSAEHMEGWGRFLPAAIATGVLPSLHDPVSKRFPTVSAQDVGLVAADLLLRSKDEDRGSDRIDHVEGPYRYSAAEVAAAYSQLLGRRIKAEAMPRSHWGERLSGVMSAGVLKPLTEFYDAHNKGLIDVEPGVGRIHYGRTELIDALRPIVAAAIKE